MKKVGLYFGTFNPIHVGHLIIANHMADYTELDEVWLIVTPQNPFKEKSSLLADYHRLALVRNALEDNPKVKPSDIEFNLPKPSYTIHTLLALEEKYPETEFALIMGEDNLRTLHKWKGYEQILNDHQIYVYPRPLTIQEKEDLKEHRTPSKLANHPRVVQVDAPVMKLSSSFIRKAIKEGHNVRYLLTDPVHKYISEMHFYKP
ncbi:MAG TPA: nicotinate (nicotinamide) nucleotide adenylyltransferase [Cryomorphaceae bacterium]|nr:nicotinate (nicotinamide) nucleotide adenylyltransferase [Cryomorphaceae bacterium]